ncbi:FecR family protein [Chitinophaga lutea]
MDKQNAADIWARYREGVATPEERALIEDWVTFGEFPEPERSEAVIDGDLADVGRMLPLSPPVRRRLWPRIAVAATIALAIGLTWYGLSKRAPQQPDVAAAQTNIAPGKNQAVLTLANGKAIALSSAQTGVVINMANLRYTDGSAVDGATAAPQESAWHSVATPRGGQYQIVLQDGSKVWLNAGSLLKFPETFGGRTTREVELTGEAYFEVAKNAQQPFVVRTPRQQVEVLGTRFNINCYADEKYTKTTLLQGSVRVAPADGKGGEVLKPGQQAILGGNAMRVISWDTEEAVAWKNGNFDFRNEPLEDILRKVSRWYDVDIAYENGAPAGTALYGKISRSKSINAVIKVLEISGGVKIRLEGRKLIVSHT